MAASSRSENALDCVTFAWIAANVTVDELFQGLDCEILLVGLTHFGEELVRQDGYVRLSSPAAFMMSTISVETTARLTICWIASSRSAALLLPSPGTLLIRVAAGRRPVHPASST